MDRRPSRQGARLDVERDARERQDDPRCRLRPRNRHRRPNLIGLSEIDRHGAVAIIALDNERTDEFDLKRAFRSSTTYSRTTSSTDLFVEDCGPLVERQPDGDLGPSRGIIALAPKLAWLREHEDLTLIIIDTMLGAAGGADTSDGPAMSMIMQVARTIAERLNCSVDTINHLTKGGAARDPDSMDAALGARSASATPRFMTHLKKEGGLVRVTQVKRSYMGPSGCPLYEFKSIDIASARPEDQTRTVDRERRHSDSGGEGSDGGGLRRRGRASGALGSARQAEGQDQARVWRTSEGRTTPA